MQTTIQKWGNSLALRIPKGIAHDLGISENAAVEILIRDGSLVVVPIKPDQFSLETMLEQITDDNKHSEITTGDSVGNEVW